MKMTRATAHFSPRPLVGDAALASPFWQQCPAYELSPARDTGRRNAREGGTVRYAWCEEFIYAAFELADSDPVTDATAHQQRLWELGDVAEWFLQPPDGTAYWEWHAAPNGHKACLFLPGPGRRGLPSNFCTAHAPHLRVAALVRGFLNAPRRTSEGWSAVFAFPRSVLAQLGTPIEAGVIWRTLAARYNYAHALPAPELTSFPRLPRTDFHTPQHFAALTFSS